MMEWIPIVVAIVFVGLGAVCVASIAFNLPGAWMLLILAAGIEFLDRYYLTGEATQTFDVWLLIVCAALASIGEVIEFLAGAAGAKRGGASRRGIIGALVGGILGAIVLSIPVPVIGTLIGGAIGAFVGAVLGEITGATPKSLPGSVAPATGATIGRLVGTIGKLVVAIAIWIALSVAAFVP